MGQASRILAGTPPWVMLLFAYLLWQGIVSRRDRTVPIWRALVIPAMFIALGLSRLPLSHETGIVPLLIWTAGAVPFSLVGFATAPPPSMEATIHWRVMRPGSVTPLVRNISLFTLQYCVAVATILAPGKPVIADMGHAMSGATAGYFLGWASAFLLHLNRGSRTANHRRQGIAPLPILPAVVKDPV